jgi:Cathepsin propeptide inhibitor domain (I29)
MRFEIFQKNYVRIKEQNWKYKHHQSTYKSALNKFSDLTPEELHQRMGFIMPPKVAPPQATTPTVTTTLMTTTTTKEPELEVEDEN